MYDPGFEQPIITASAGVPTTSVVSSTVQPLAASIEQPVMTSVIDQPLVASVPQSVTYVQQPQVVVPPPMPMPPIVTPIYDDDDYARLGLLGSNPYLARSGLAPYSVGANPLLATGGVSPLVGSGLGVNPLVGSGLGTTGLGTGLGGLGTTEISDKRGRWL